MSISLAILEDFRSMFTGNMTSYGVHLIDNDELPDEQGKRRGKNFTNQAPVTQELYDKHLKGVAGLGIVPVDTEGKCSFSVLDVDVYGTDHKRILDIIYKNRLPLVPFRSKSGGLHIYAFFTAQEKAARVLEYMKDIRILLMLDKKTEVFPKQAILRPDESGNWINLPYFNSDNTVQYALRETGEAMSLFEAIDSIKGKRMNLDMAEGIRGALPLFDAPPCLQSIYLSKRTNNRNNYLMSLATYYKARVGDDFEFALVEANNELEDPIDIDRLNRTVIQSQKKRNYSYLCKEEPICSICNKDKCRKRKYGVGGTEVSELSYEDFIQYRTDPPYYEWKINGKSLKFFRETDIINQTAFRELCFRTLHILPMRLTDPAWTHILNTALSNVIVKTIDLENDVSSGAMFMEYLTEFLTKRAPAMTREQILVDRCYLDEELDVYVFKPKNLFMFLSIIKSFRVYSMTEIQDKLKDLGGIPTRYYVNSRSSNARVWTLPRVSLEKFIESAVDEVEVDFMEKMDNEPY